MSPAARTHATRRSSNLATFDWITKGYPLCLIGDSGTGKSHLLIALGTQAAMAGYRVRSEEAFTGWSMTFTDPRLCAAIVDRLTFNATLIETGTESYRLARARANRHNGTK